MFELLRMWALVEVLGIVCLPLTITVCHNLPDRGWAFSKVLGMALLAFAVWLPLMCLSFLPFSQLFIAGVVLIVLGCNILGAWRMRQTLIKLLRLNVIYIIACELVFLGMVLLLGWLRTFGPNIQSYEMFMDEGFISSIMRSPHLPPNDMWFSGYTINYYYYAHYVIAMLAKLIGQSPSIAFNTGISIYFGLTAVNLFGVTCNIVAWARHLRKHAGAMEIEADQEHPALFGAVPYGLFTILAGLVLGNLAATQQWWQNHGTNAHFDWFQPSRVIERTINEFPAFSFLLSCFHAHVLALAFTIAAIGLAFNLFLGVRGRGLFLFGQGWRLPLTLGMTALIIGSLFVMNGWDYPTYIGLALVCIGLQQWLAHQSRFSLEWLLHVIMSAVCLVALSLLLYLPFYLHFISPSQGLGIITKATDHSQLRDELLIYGLFAFVFVSLLLASVLMRPLSEALKGEQAETSLWHLVAIILLLVVAVLVFWRVPNSTVLVIFGSVAALGIILLFTHLKDRAHAFTLLLGALAFLLVAGCEVFFVRDVFEAQNLPRFNTIFKFYFQAWALLAIVSGCGLYFIAQGFRSLSSKALPVVALRWGVQGLWSLFLLVLVLASAVYPLIAPYERFAQYGSLPVSGNIWSSNSLDGLMYLKTFRVTLPRQQADPNASPNDFFQYDAAGDYAAIRWLNANVQDDPVIIEAKGNDYTTFGRVSAFTGLPTPMGWVGHEYQWRVNWLNNSAAWMNFNSREADVNMIYTDPQSQNVLAKMAHYNAQYLYVGSLEYGKYPTVDLKRFSAFMQVVYDSQGVTIYKVR